MMMMPSIFGENLFDHWFDDPFEHALVSGHSPLYGKREKNLMKTDVQDNGNDYAVSIDLPGFKKEEVKLQLEDGYLTISAAKDLEKEDKATDNSGYIRKERWSGACSRSFYVGDGVRQEDIKAKMEDGILTMTIPKVTQAPEAQKFIEIE